ncbi:hypothetical protein SAMD00019534_109790 [Acytostelium subglobosum LB1]|uniref:hypothetical protein n=1 Tax=Acytostelium subglobosum LB1 TaxID=1410327 RepID=UPI000644EE29|nr:hypothetical protein SAMD00019534_109790 [Acytostelium subglobosum LB1]GAM27803.1 hypothetical protein SAMD00019534_109790 [Acytostelium subglobosum LB1]|eukprot:XP_012749086.1 hypothetical protein SAMD00019534_109790 [Acytostelium subglobosum LB1]
MSSSVMANGTELVPIVKESIVTGVGEVTKLPFTETITWSLAAGIVPGIHFAELLKLPTPPCQEISPALATGHFWH